MASCLWSQCKVLQFLLDRIGSHAVPHVNQWFPSRWHCSSSIVALSSHGRQRYLNLPCGRRNVVSLLDSLSSLHWNYASFKSSTKWIWLLAGIFCYTASLEGNRWIGLDRALLRGVKSVSSLTRFPSGFSLKNACVSHFVLECCLQIIFVLTRSLIIFFARPCMCIGVLLAVCTRNGVIPSFTHIFTGLALALLIPSLLWNRLEYSLHSLLMFLSIVSICGIEFTSPIWFVSNSGPLHLQGILVSLFS